MLIVFDAIWIPIAITVLAIGWAAFILHEPNYSGSGPLFEWSIAIAWPSIPVLISWLIWSLLT